MNNLKLIINDDGTTTCILELTLPMQDDVLGFIIDQFIHAVNKINKEVGEKSE